MTLHIEQLQGTPLDARMARGHKMRLGHDLQAVKVSADGILWHTVRLCCGETIPDESEVKTWEDMT